MSGVPPVAGIDLALASTGVARIIWDENGKPQSSTFQIKSESDATAGIRKQHERLADITRRVLDACGDAHLIVIESPNFGRGQQAGSHDISGLWWRVVGALLDGGRDIAQVSPSTLKVYVVGYGGSAKRKVTKAEMRRAVEQRYPSILTGGIHDVADAIGLAAMGARHLGHPIEDLLITHLKAMNSVRWPYTNPGDQK